MNRILSLKKSNCKNCYKCIRNCPVKSIKFEDGQAHILPDECILCGRCFVACPQDAKQLRNDVDRVRQAIAEGRTVIASVAPSFIAEFPLFDFAAMRRALMQLGFADAEETAIGATIVKYEYQKLVAAGEMDVIISTCCHTVNSLIQKYFPGALHCLAPVLSPMQAHCKEIKAAHPDAMTVFIGPCISKKEEADIYGITDVALTFEEVEAWMDEAGVSAASEEKPQDVGKRGRFFPVTGGIIRSMDTDDTGYTYIAVDGVENCVHAIKEIEAGNLHKVFIEMSACTGSCVYLGVHNARPSEHVIREILAKMGKTRPEQELNCGSCGYSTCREKAIAVYQGKADLTMCMPYLKEKAETFSGYVINSSPNGIFVLDEDLCVQQINRAACELFNLRGPEDIVGSPIVRILNPSDYITAMNGCPISREKKHYLAEYDKYVAESIVYDKEYHIIFSVMRDITQEERREAKKAELQARTVEITDKVIEKQMRVVQEIASLLGETTAETKIALTQLKDTLQK